MCQYINAEGLMPGYSCCKCQNYNGLQRVVRVNGFPFTECRNGCRALCELAIDDPTIVQCENCFAGFPKGLKLVGNLAGEKFPDSECPACKETFGPVAGQAMPARDSGTSMIH